jgi:hypothetical protein
MNTSSNRHRGIDLLMAAATGAVAMYALDPQHGRRRRALGRDQILHLRRRMQDELGTALRDLQHRLRGWAARARGTAQRGPADDYVLVERVRSALGRATLHPHAIRVGVASGRVTLSGPVYASEEDRIVAAVHAVPGVLGVECRLERHGEDDDLPALRGRRARSPAHPQPAHWAPGTRLLALATGLSLAACGIAARRRSAFSLALVSAGAALATRAIANDSRGAIAQRAAPEATELSEGSTAPAAAPPATQHTPAH